MQEAAELPCVAPEQAALEQAVERFDRWQARPGAFQAVACLTQSSPRHGVQKRLAHLNSGRARL